MSDGTRPGRPDAVLLDVDGVILGGPTFKDVLAERYGILPGATESFFTGPFVRCQLGLADLRHELRRALPAWGWPAGVQDFLDEWFRTESTVSTEVLAAVARGRRDGVPVYLATAQERIRLAHLLDTLGLAMHVDGAFATCDIGYLKSEPRYFEEVLRRLGTDPSRVLLVDDTRANTDTARRCGIRTILYHGVSDLEQGLRGC